MKFLTFFSTLVLAAAVHADLTRPNQHGASHAGLARKYKARGTTQEPLPAAAAAVHPWKRAMGPTWTSQPGLRVSNVQTGVAGMQLTVTVRPRPS